MFVIFNPVRKKYKSYDSLEKLYEDTKETPNILIKIYEKDTVNYIGKKIQHPLLYLYPLISEYGLFPAPYFFGSNDYKSFFRLYPNNIDCEPLVESEYTEIFLSENEFVSLEIPKSGDLFIKAPMGCGKTTAVVRELGKLGDDTTILVISPRRTITATIFRKFESEGVGINNYLKCKINSKSIRRIIISPNSLIKLGTIIQYDVVVIDEIMLLLEYVFSDHPRQKKKMLITLETILSQCRQIICSDAFLFPKIIDILVKYRKTTAKFLEFHRSEKIKYIPMDLKTFDDEIITRLTTKTKTYIFCESKKKAQKLFERLDKLRTAKILLITSDSENKVSILSDPNISFVGYDFVITSPIILSGFDFNVDYFSEIFGIFNGNILSTISIIQMSGRIRKAKTCFLVNTRKAKTNPIYLPEKYFSDNIDNYFGIELENDGKNNFVIRKTLVSELFIFIRQYVSITRGRFEEYIKF